MVLLINDDGDRFLVDDPTPTFRMGARLGPTSPFSARQKIAVAEKIQLDPVPLFLRP